MADVPVSVPVDLRADGVLWMVNRTVFHPQGYALAVDVETGALSLMGDGIEVWAYDLDEDARLEAFRALLTRAAEAT